MKQWLQTFLTDLIDNDTLIIGGLLVLAAVYTVVIKETQLARDVAIGLIGYMGKTVSGRAGNGQNN